MRFLYSERLKKAFDKNSRVKPEVLYDDSGQCAQEVKLAFLQGFRAQISSFVCISNNKKERRIFILTDEGRASSMLYDARAR